MQHVQFFVRPGGNGRSKITGLLTGLLRMFMLDALMNVVTPSVDTPKATTYTGQVSAIHPAISA